MAKFRKAIGRAVGRLRAAGCPVVALDVGSGSGALALAAAAVGADTVVAAEVHPGLVSATRRSAAENGLGHKIVVVPGDVGELVRGQDLPYSGANLIIFDIFDAGLLGHRVLPTLECVKRRLAGAAAPSYDLGAADSTSQPPPHNAPSAERDDDDDDDDEKREGEEGPRQRQAEQRNEQQNGYAGPREVDSNSDSGNGDSSGGSSSGGSSSGGSSGLVEVIPAAALVWVVGLEVLTRRVCGEDLSAVNKYRWDDKYEAVRLQDIPYYRQLTVPVQVFNFDFTQPPDDVGVGAGLYGHSTGRTRPYPSTARVEAEVISKGTISTGRN
ncbi:hypothetical protein Vafri_20436 [Volvox africanus]|nr:hypothetical protein Vafri_20436 [Volvox africanus]